VVVVGPFHAIASTGTAGFRRARVTNKHKFGTNVEPPNRKRALQAGNSERADTNFCAVGSHNRISFVHRAPGNGINARGRSASVVAVETESALNVKFRLGPRTKN